MISKQNCIDSLCGSLARSPKRGREEADPCEIFGPPFGQRQATGIGRDDLIDACACAFAARDSTDTVPVRGAQTNGMQAEIWC